MRRCGAVLAAVVGLLLAARGGAAQCTGTPLALTPPPSPASVVFTTPVDADFQTGYVAYAGVLTVTINPSNGKAYTLCAHAGTPDMGVSDLGTYVKPVADLQIRPTAAAGYISLSQADQAIVSGLKKSQTVTLDVQVVVSWNDEPGRYVSSIVFTAYQ